MDSKKFAGDGRAVSALQTRFNPNPDITAAQTLKL